MDIWFLRFPVIHPRFYWFIAFLISAYYGYRAIRIHRRDVHNENIQTENVNICLTKKGKKGDLKSWSKSDKILVHLIQGVIFNSVCSLAGFSALYEEAKIFSRIDIVKIEPGAAILIAFLTLLGIIGISGMLPQIIVHGKIFGGK